jgi:hypothetical protein
MVRFVWTQIILGALVLTSGCLQTENSSAIDAPEVMGESNFVAVAQVLQGRCVKCHDEFQITSEAELRTVKGRFTGRLVVVPGFPEQSSLYSKLIGSTGGDEVKDMPAGGDGNLSSGEILSIHDFIQSMTP